MRPTHRILIVALVLIALGPVAAFAAANHIVISEFATRGPAAATDEFVELYNPTANAINISGWKLQYKAATSSIWNDRAVLPSTASIPAHGFFLIANQSYVGAVTPDFSSSLWNSGSGMADNGHARILDVGAAEVDKVGFGSAIDPEGGVDAPNHGTSANGNSVERKALANSTADSLGAGGAHAQLGNGQDTNVNGSDFVAQTHGRNPQNNNAAPEPSFSNNGSGTGTASIQPSVVFANSSIATVKLSFRQSAGFTLTRIAILVPGDWTWSHSTGSVALAGSAFTSATTSILGDSIFVDSAALSAADSGSVTISNLTSPPTKGGSFFNVRTAVAAATLAPIAPQPSIRVLQIVPIVTVHVNDASGVPASPYAIGSEATVTGVVTANLSTIRTDVYVQDGTGGIDLFNAALGPLTLAPGDSITVTGSVLQFRGLTELQPDFALLTRHATGLPVAAPLVMTCADLNATFQVDFSEPNESRLIRINGATYNSVTSTITDASGTANIFIPNTFPPTPSVFDAIGILKQFKPGTPAPGPPFTADYELAPRVPEDIIAHPGPIFLTTPYEDNLQPTSVQIHWTTDVASTSTVRYGLTAALVDSVTDGNAVTTHTITVPGLTPATVYHYSAGSTDGAGTNYSSPSLFSTASPPASTGAMNVYFNKSVNTTVAWLHAANANQDLVARLVPRLNAAHRSIDAALYSLSGTPGSSLATALIAAKNRGVKVRVICEFDNSGGSGFTALTGAGVALINDRFDPINNGAGLMHNKFFVIDGRAGAPESTWVWTGSWNPTNPGTNDDFQNSIEVQDQALARTYTLEFNEMWGSSTDTPNASISRFGARKLNDTPHKFTIGGRNVESYFSPSDDPTLHILSTINAAQHSIGFELLTLTRADISSALIAKHNAGLKVRGDLDSDTDTGSEFATLVNGGVDVRLKTGASGLLHHKYMITDTDSPHFDGTVLTGSHNWSASAETSNNENTLIVRDPDIANQYLQEFTARYYQFGGTDPVVVTDVTGGGPETQVWMSQNYPNPARGSTSFMFAIPKTQKVVLKLYDVRGRAVRTLVNGQKGAGRYVVTLDNRGIAAGMYLYRLQVGDLTQERKMVILK